MNALPSSRLDWLDLPARARGADTDWVGLWYAVAAERGINHVCTLTELDTEAGTAAYHDFSHARFDGVGALGHILRERGFHLPTLPSGRPTQPPSLPRLLLRRGHLWELLRPKHVPWRQVASPRTPGPHELSFFTLSRSQTAALRAARDRTGASPNALLLAAAHRVVAARFLTRDDPADWLFGVNLRGSIALPDDTANHSTGIPIRCTAASTPDQLHAQVRDRLGSGLHFLAFEASRIGRLVGVAAMRRISRRFERRSFWMGTFSNMGEWPPDGSDPDPDPRKAWACIPPGTPNYPIGIGLLTWHGRLTVCMKVHPRVCSDPSVPPAVLDELVGTALRWAGLAGVAG